MVAREKLAQSHKPMVLAAGLAVGLALPVRMALWVAGSQLLWVAVAVEQRLPKVATAALQPSMELRDLLAALPAAARPVAVLLPIPPSPAPTVRLA